MSYRGVSSETVLDIVTMFFLQYLQAVVYSLLLAVRVLIVVAVLQYSQHYYVCGLRNHCPFVLVMNFHRRQFVSFVF